jgi:hypothetical protein
VIEFDEDTHIYRVDGVVMPSVTQILDAYTGLEFVNRELLRRAAEFGNHVHRACDLYDTGQLDEASLDPALVPYLDGWKAFLEDTGAVVVLSECWLASRRHGYAGTLDKLVWWGKSKRLVDVKSGTVVPRTVGPQTSAYAEAYTEETGERIRDRYCIHLPGDGKYRSHRLNDPRDFPIFKSALVVHNWYRRAA